MLTPHSGASLGWFREPVDESHFRSRLVRAETPPRRYGQVFPSGQSHRTLPLTALSPLARAVDQEASPVFRLRRLNFRTTCPVAPNGSSSRRSPIPARERGSLLAPMAALDQSRRSAVPLRPVSAAGRFQTPAAHHDGRPHRQEGFAATPPMPTGDGFRGGFS
jgi:hypothetical protein